MQNKMKLINKLKHIKKLKIKENVKLSPYTTFKVGGTADIFLIPENITALKKCIKVITTHKVPWFVLGKGSNIIVSDRGFEGTVIYMGELTKVTVQKNILISETGITLNKLAGAALEAGLSGLEFAAGIPGTLGGALFMNAGAYGDEIKNLLKNTEVINCQGKKGILTSEEMNFSYRHSCLQKKDVIAVKASLKLKSDNKNKIKKRMKNLNQKRHKSQPLNRPSAGSAFKRPENHYAGALIENTGLKGTSIGGAKVSEKHAGFIINTGNATAKNIKELIHLIQNKVYEENGIMLEPEPEFIGNFD